MPSRRSRRRKRDRRRDYHVYIQSAEWKDRRDRFRGNQRACSMCLAVVPLQGHHVTYNRLGREKRDDIVFICEACHLYVHRLQTTAQITIEEATKFGFIDRWPGLEAERAALADKD